MKQNEYQNESHRVIMEALHNAGVPVKNPIMLTANQYEKEYSVSCEYMSVGVHIPKTSIDSTEVNSIDEEKAGYRFILNNVWHQKD